MKDNAEDLNSFLKKYDNGELFNGKPNSQMPKLNIKNNEISQTEIILPNGSDYQAETAIPVEIKNVANEKTIQETKNSIINKNETNTSRVNENLETSIKIGMLQSHIETLQMQFKTLRYTMLIACLFSFVAIILAVTLNQG